MINDESDENLGELLKEKKKGAMASSRLDYWHDPSNRQAGFLKKEEEI